MSKEWDRTKFNTDPKHEADRKRIDEMLEDSLTRIAERKKKEKDTNPPKENSFIDDIIDGVFGAAGGGKSTDDRMTVSVEKNRLGEAGFEALLSWYGPHMRISDWTHSGGHDQ